jgi:hypothetical protein
MTERTRPYVVIADPRTGYIGRANRQVGTLTIAFDADGGEVFDDAGHVCTGDGLLYTGQRLFTGRFAAAVVEAFALETQQ